MILLKVSLLFQCNFYFCELFEVSNEELQYFDMSSKFQNSI